MGTRSTIAIYEGKQHLVTIYQQYDGYPSGAGKELAKFLQSGQLVNGIGLDDRRVFNGMGCLAAQLIHDLKDGPGGQYIVPKGQKEEYNYTVVGEFDSPDLLVSCHDETKRLCKPCSPVEFLAWCEAQE